ncbi:MAG TPA: hypothetical protein VG870_10990 [Chitinophagaceae bacterium]|nr:hypothetical protein [Chitinophagaceae bacterium]
MTKRIQDQDVLTDNKSYAFQEWRCRFEEHAAERPDTKPRYELVKEQVLRSEVVLTEREAALVNGMNCHHINKQTRIPVKVLFRKGEEFPTGHPFDTIDIFRVTER